MKKSSRRPTQYLGIDENWILKPLHNQPSVASTSYQNQEHSRASPQKTNFRRKSKWVPRKRGEKAVKPEVGSVNFCPEEEKELNLGGASGNCLEEENLEEERCNGLEFNENLGDNVIENMGVNIEKRGSDEIAKRLNELKLGENEIELSEEILSTNDQLQQDELTAMESIYGENLFIIDKQSGIRCFQINVHIESPKDFTVSTRLNSSSNIEMKSDSTPEFSYSFNVQYLPPIVLTCLLPKSYPSHLPPSFTMSVQWLSSSKISSLCSMLDLIWNEQPGQEVMYQWVHWLQSCSLSYLGFDEEIILGPYDIKHTGDKRAISGNISPDVDIPSVKSYNEEQCHETFVKNFHECCICYSEFSGKDFIRLPCQHFFCWTCMKTYVDINAREGAKAKLSCPEDKCEVILPSSLLKQLLGDEEFRRWEALMLEKTLASMSNLVYCPRCETACIADEDHDAQCSKCFFCFCSLCQEKRHIGTSCMTPEMKLLILQDRQISTQLNSERKRREKDMINEILSVKEILRDAKQCPSCKMAISRTEGCNKMVCNNCGNYFCYRCNRKIDGYEHFRQGACELFPREMIENWEHANARQAEGQIMAQLFGARGHAHQCPLCGQLNAKVGNNNHIYCWACRNHYCFTCKKIVKRGSNHYGPKGCKQHTV